MGVCLLCALRISLLIYAINNRYCPLNVLPRCEPWNYTVVVTVPGGKRFSAWVDYPTREGNPRAAAEHLRCRVHDLHFLTCSWAVGAEAPGDVQYEFYLEDLGTTQKWPCPHYTKGEPGAHVGCQFADVSRLPAEEYWRYFRFVVQGTSGGSRVPCSEIFASFSEIEELVAPNLTATCNKSLAVLQWAVFSHFNLFFDYELKIHKDSGDPITDKNLSEESWRLPNPGTFTVTVRAHGGLWSAPQRFVCDPEDKARLYYVWLSALATLLAVGAAILLCKKCSVLQKLFPPIPHMKDPIVDNHVHEKMMAWQAGAPTPEDCPVAEVQLVKST
ncbi:interleukin-3 receptor subunit alpha isoform X1 [Phyllostomus hastatus]|uniref:interleukin-3 receptor subunit alpha isoform X1 n=1 Tax=Phyllostomus hastatus TaxID=9423 RepID=UPI001E67E830|nr:interleukin-3 receptor subunit alpha isoform X1 [Phyllostomus hastatus]